MKRAAGLRRVRTDWHKRVLGNVRFSAGYEGEADISRNWPIGRNL